MAKMIKIVQFFSSSKRILLLHKRRKRTMGADESDFRVREPVDGRYCGPYHRLIEIPLIQVYGFS